MNGEFGCQGRHWPRRSLHHQRYFLCGQKRSGSIYVRKEKRTEERERETYGTSFVIAHLGGAAHIPPPLSLVLNTKSISLGEARLLRARSMCGSTEEKMSVFFRACEIRRVVWRTSSSVESFSVDKAGAMMELRKDFRV